MEWLHTALALAGDYRFAPPAIALAVAGVWARVALPAGKPIAMAAWALALAVGLFGAGFSTAKRNDRTAELSARADALLADINNARAVAAADRARAEAADQKGQADDQIVAELKASLAARGDCPVPADALERLRGIGAAGGPAASAGRARRSPPARAAAAPVGAVAALAEHRAALARANRKIMRWREFYDDVQARFGE